MSGDRARTALAGTRFAEVRWVEETGSTNDDAMAAARAGATEGLVVVADAQRAGRGRLGRAWTAPSGASLLVSVLLRPIPSLVPFATMTAGVAMAEAIELTAGVTFGLKWPNDLVRVGPVGTDRKVAGILAESDWSSVHRGDGRVVVVVGVGVNVNWPTELPADLADRAVAINHVTGRSTAREELLVAFLRRLDEWYGALAAGGSRAVLVQEWRRRSATLGGVVRVELAASEVVGTAIALTDDGELVVEVEPGRTVTVTAGDVTLLRHDLPSERGPTAR